MWIHTVNGFVSIVKHNKIPNCLLVRGRVKADLEAILGDDYEITTEPGSDYTYRAIVDAEDVAVIIADAILSIDYTSHFKDVTIKRAPKVEHGSRSKALYAIWHAMSDLQGYRPYSKHPRTQETIATRRPHGRGAGFGQDSLFDDGWTRRADGTWAQRPAGKGASTTTKATTGHYDWSQHPQSATYAGNGQSGNVSMDEAMEILDELNAQPLMDDVAEDAAVEEAIEDAKANLDAEHMAKIDELTEYALANFPGSEEWDVDTWKAYYEQNLQHAAMVASVVSPVVDTETPAVLEESAPAKAEPAPSANWSVNADDEAKADWESLEARENERRGPAGKPGPAAVKAGGKTATRRRTTAAKVPAVKPAAGK